MKKFIFVFFAVSVFILSSCSLFPLLPNTDTTEDNLAKTMLLSSQNMFSDFLFDVYSNGTQTTLSDFEKLSSSKLQKNSTVISINSLSVLQRELVSKDSPLSLSITSLSDNEKNISHKSADITYENEKFSAVLFSSEDSCLAAFSCLADTYLDFPLKASIKDSVSVFLSSEHINPDRFSVSRTDCRFGDSVIKDTTKIALDLENTDLSPLISDIFDYLDPLFQLSDEKEYILNNISSPPGTAITVYIKDSKTVCAEIVFTISDTEYNASVFFDNSELYQSAKIYFTKSSSPARKIFSLEFFQTLSAEKKSGTVSVTVFPKELFGSKVTMPSSITFNADYDTVISNARQNCTMTADLEYTLFGITSSYRFPISIISELLDGNFLTTISMSAENTEISEFDARISFSVSTADSLDIKILSPVTVTPVKTKQSADAFLSSFSSEFEQKYPNLRYLIFKNYRIRQHDANSIITAKNHESGDTFILYVNDIDSSSITGNGEYLKEITYTENGNTIFITERSEKNNCTLSALSAERTVLEDGSLTITEKDGTVWRLFPHDGTGYCSKPVKMSLDFDDDCSRGTLSIYFSDDNPLLKDVRFTINETSVILEGTEYEYSVY